MICKVHVHFEHTPTFVSKSFTLLYPSILTNEYGGVIMIDASDYLSFPCKATICLSLCQCVCFVHVHISYFFILSLTTIHACRS